MIFFLVETVAKATNSAMVEREDKRLENRQEPPLKTTSMATLATSAVLTTSIVVDPTVDSIIRPKKSPNNYHNPIILGKLSAKAKTFLLPIIFSMHGGFHHDQPLF